MRGKFSSGWGILGIRRIRAEGGSIDDGSIGFAITGMFLGTARFATLSRGVLPPWTGWLAFVATALCAAFVPAIYRGPVDYNGFSNAGGWGPAVVADFPPLSWVLGRRDYSDSHATTTSRPSDRAA